MTQEITMGSLFSGSGGFELAGSIFGIIPIWASEIEPFPILVTTKNFPEMKHLGVHHPQAHTIGVLPSARLPR